MHFSKQGKLLFFIVTGISVLVQLSAASAIAETIIRESSSGRVIGYKPSANLLAEQSAGDPRTAAARALRDAASAFGINDSADTLRFTHQVRDNLGLTHVRYGQLKNGVPIYAAGLTVHLGANSSLRYIDGSVSNDSSDLNVIPAIDASAAVAKAQSDWVLRFGAEGDLQAEPRLVVLDYQLLGENYSSAPALAWLIHLYHRIPTIENEKIFVDAHSGEVLKRLTNRSHAVSRLILDCSPGAPCFADAPQQGGGYIFGRSEGQPARGAHPLFGTFDTDNVYDQIGAVHGYFEQRFGRNGANNQGGIGDGLNAPAPLSAAFVHLNTVTDQCPNAFFDGFSLNFCNNVVSLDVTAHEYQHAVTNYAVRDGNGSAVGLIYQRESGALNESYSDIFAELAELRLTGNNDFLVGVGINAPPLIGPIRSMQNPPDFGQPDRFHSELMECGNFDNGGVHINSGVLNKAVYLLMAGGTFNGCTVNSIGADMTEQIFYRALTLYLTPNSTFNFAYQSLLQSCADLAPASTVCAELQKALQAVELDQPGHCSGTSASVPQCAEDNAPPVNTPAPPQNTPAAPEDTEPANILINSSLLKRNTKQATYNVEGAVLNSSSVGIADAAVNLSCTNSGRRITGDINTDAEGNYSFRVILRSAGMMLCRATSGEAASQFLKLIGPKSWRRAKSKKKIKK